VSASRRNNPIRVAINGGAGRMGRALVQACVQDTRLALAAVIEIPASQWIGLDAGAVAGLSNIDVKITDSLSHSVSGVDVVVDFTRPEATIARLAECERAGKAMVIGTTGLDDNQRARIADAAKQIPIMLSPNMSIGVNVALRMIDIAARAFGDDVDIEIIEAHHRHKVDAPSGTALRMGEVAAAARNRRLADCAVYTREGQTGPRPEGAIGFATVRAGDIVGDHTVLFAGEGERVEIIHRATSRSNFAQGAMRACAWVAGRQPGLYSMADVLGL